MRLLHQRHRRPELMDQPNFSPTERVKELRGLARLNWVSNSSGILWPELAELARGIAPRIPRVLDVATGGGDVPVRLWRRARRAGLELHLEGCDISPVGLELARRNAAAAGAPLRFFEYDALSGPTLTGYDAILCSLFLHHLDEAPAIALLRRMADMAGRLVLVNDLNRVWRGWLAAHVVGRLLTTSHAVHVDGPRSVAQAFTPAEALELAQGAGLSGARVGRRWPFRWLLSWRRS